MVIYSIVLFKYKRDDFSREVNSFKNLANENKELKNNPEIVLAAVQEDESAIQYADKSWKKKDKTSGEFVRISPKNLI